MRITKDIGEYCMDLYTYFTVLKENKKKKQNVQWEIPKQIKTESKE